MISSVWISSVRRRSKLFAPGSRPDLMAKAVQSQADMILFDLEDAVAPGEKSTARGAVRQALVSLDFGSRERGVRINAIDTEYWLDDLTAVLCEQIDAIHLPKVMDPRAVWIAEAVLRDLERKTGRSGRPVRIIPTLETPAGIEQARSIALASSRVAALQFGLGDLKTALGLDPAPHRLAYFRAQITLAAHAAGIPALDTVYFDYRNSEGYRTEAAEARAMGFRGKSCIHPAQVPIANAIFGPTAAEIAEAKAVVRAWDEGQRQGQGAVGLQGRMIDKPVVEQARQILQAAAELGLAEPLPPEGADGGAGL